MDGYKTIHHFFVPAHGRLSADPLGVAAQSAARSCRHALLMKAAAQGGEAGGLLADQLAAEGRAVQLDLAWSRC